MLSPAMKIYRSRVINITRMVFLLGGCFTFSQGQEDCLGCAVGSAIFNSFWVTGETAIDGLDLVGGALKGLFLPNPNGITDPARGLVDAPVQPDMQPAPGTPTIPKNADPTVPDIHLYVETPAIPPEGLARGNKCDPGNFTPDNCGISTAQIVWPTSCDPTRNEIIRSALVALAPPGGVRTFHNKCGIFFWTAALTQQQIQNLMASNLDIRNIVPNGVGVNNAYSRVRERAKGDVPVVFVESQSTENLAYYSTPPGKDNPDKSYAHVMGVGDGVEVYWIDSTLNLPNPEFRKYNVLKNVYYAEDFDPLEPNIDNSDHGGCMLSVLGGSSLGVVRVSNLNMVKVHLEDSSMLSGLERILTVLEEREGRGEKVKGRTVVGTSSTYPWKFDMVNENEAGNLIKEMINRFQAVFVASSGNTFDGEDDYSEISGWPALLAEDPTIPVIAVGAVNMADGQIYPWSKGGPGLTITAPGRYACIQNGVAYYSHGTSGAAAMLGGAVADVLSRDYLRNELNLLENEADPPQGPSVAVKVRDYLLRKAYARAPGGPPCIWNGLYYDDPTRVEP